MSSYQGEAGETLASIAKRIPADLSQLSVDELQSMLRGIKGDAEDMYAVYAYNMGWADSEQEARDSLRDVEEDHGGDHSNSPIFWFEIPDWLAKKKEIPARFQSACIEKTDRAYLTIYDWIPKSQCTRTETENTVIVAGQE